jgi:subtilisin family serine protease
MRIRLLTMMVFVGAMIGSLPSRAYWTSQSRASALNKIAPWVLENTVDGRQAEFLVIMSDQADLSAADQLKTKIERGRFVYQTLSRKALETQVQLLSWLKSRNIEHRSYYIVNMVFVKGNFEVATALAQRSDVAKIEGNPEIRNRVEPPDSEIGEAASPTLVGGGIAQTRAPEVWALGFTGQGVVIAGADTGYKWDHLAIKNQYGGSGVVVNHDFNWHDSIHSGGGSCGPNSPQPCDDAGHGTHTMGTAVGDDGMGNQIGMAPGAKWIGCRNMDQGVGTPATYTECMEFFLAPYPVNGTPSQGNPDLAPDVTTNSWGCPADEGCSPGTLQTAVEAQRAAGIMMVVAAGNRGPSCSTVDDPPGLFDASYTVGAINHTNGIIASFSSRGPVTIDGSGRPKPDISAPGVSIRSATNTSTTAYVNLSGTSMATPHVAGGVALLWSARPDLRNNVTLSEVVLNSAAVKVASTLCGSSGSPNNVYGSGLLDIKAALGGGTDTIGLFRPTGNLFFLRNTNPFGSPDVALGFGAPGDLPIVGDWDGNGTVTVGLYRPSTSTFFLRNTNMLGPPDITLTFGDGPGGDLPIAGDWDGNGTWTIGVYRPGTSTFFIRNSNSFGVPDIEVTFGAPGDMPIIGDWDGNGTMTIGLFRPSSNLFFLRNGNTAAPPDVTVSFGAPGELPIVGDWDGNGTTTIGLFRPSGNFFFLRNSNTTGPPDITIGGFGAPGDRAITGNWDGQ